MCLDTDHHCEGGTTEAIQKTTKKLKKTDQEGLPFARPKDEQLLKVNIRDLQRMELNHLISFLDLFKQASNKP